MSSIESLKKIFDFFTGIGNIIEELKVQSDKERSSLFIIGLIFFALFLLIPFLIAYYITTYLDLLVIVMIGLITSFLIRRALINIELIRNDLEEKANKLIYDRLKKMRENFEKKYNFYVAEVNTDFCIFRKRNISNSIYVIFFISILNCLPLAYLIQNYTSLLALQKDFTQICIQILLVYMLTMFFLNIISLMLIYGQRNEKFNYYKITLNNEKEVIGKIIKENKEEIILTKSGEIINIKKSEIKNKKMIA